VDVGSRQQIFAFLRTLIDERRSVLCASSDYEQLGAICDRVIVLARGRVVSELAGDQVTKERIAERCYNAAAADVGATRVHVSGNGATPT
jgi:ribose transport system ATP-binding protein